MTKNSRLRFLIISAALTALIILIQSCDDTLVTNDIDQRYIPDSNVSYSANLMPVFQLKCATSGCHNSESLAAGINMLDWNSFTIEPYIIRGEPDISTMVLMVEGSIQPTMPPPNYASSIPFTADQIRGLKVWIKEGAKNN